MKKCIAIPVLLILAGCAKFTAPDGKPMATVYWPMTGEMTVDATRITAGPADRSIDAATTVGLALAKQSPEAFAAFGKAMAEKVPAPPPPGVQ
jgi:hypothetical protein